jgi:hypothetical protein
LTFDRDPPPAGLVRGLTDLGMLALVLSVASLPLTLLVTLISAILVVLDFQYFRSLLRWVVLYIATHAAMFAPVWIAMPDSLSWLIAD